MATLVIVHGGWGGGWEWTPVARLLRERGHEVFTPTLTGMGERTHQGSEVRLSGHVDDDVGVFRFEELHDVVLFGQSYGGGRRSHGSVPGGGVATRWPDTRAEACALHRAHAAAPRRHPDRTGSSVRRGRAAAPRLCPLHRQRTCRCRRGGRCVRRPSPSRGLVVPRVGDAARPSSVRSGRDSGNSSRPGEKPSLALSFERALGATWRSST